MKGILRGIAGVILGYLVMVVLVMVLLTVGWFALGADRAFQPTSFEVSLLWAVLMLGAGVLAAILGGWICALVGGGRKAAWALAAVVLVLGLVSAAPAFLPPPEGIPAERASDISMFEAMQWARQPVWFALLNPLVGAGGVLVGSILTRGDRNGASP